MEDIINAFGIDRRLIAIQLINFTILVLALGYLLYRPILKLLNEREEKIAQGLKDAEEAKSFKANAALEKQNVLTAAHQEAEAVAGRAKAAADAKTAEMLALAEVKAAELVKNAELKSAVLKEQALKESEREVAQLAILAAEKILRERANG